MSASEIATIQTNNRSAPLIQRIPDHTCQITTPECRITTASKIVTETAMLNHFACSSTCTSLERGVSMDRF